MIIRSALVTFLAIFLGGCSSEYEIRATVIGGKIAFVPASTSIRGNHNCDRTVIVETKDGQPERPAPGDDVANVARGVYWERHFGSGSCENPYPLLYVTELRGEPPSPPLRRVHVSAKPLRAGVVYEVSALSPGSAYGGGQFMITEQGTVRNLR